MGPMGGEGLSRRGFLGGAVAFGAVAGCRSGFFAVGGERPLLRFGVLSDVHVRLAKGGEGFAAGYGTETLEKTLAYFRDCGVDAVIMAGDMTDCGVIGELKAVADAWFKVFPDDRAADGRKVERLFDPAITAEERGRRYTEWQRAVERSRGWAN